MPKTRKPPVAAPATGTRVRIREIARIANVAVATVDRALNGRDRISEDTRTRILAIAESLGYRPNLAARALSVKRSPIRIGVCIPREIHYYFDELRDGILSEAHRLESLGIEVLYRPAERLGIGEVERVSEVLNEGIRALIIVPGDPERLAPIIDQAEERNIRVACVDTDASGTRRSTLVTVDPEVGGRLASELMGRFVPAGSEVAVLTGMLQTEDHRKRTQAFCAAFAEFCPGGKVVEVLEAHDDEDEAFQKCFALLDRPQPVQGVYVSTANCLPVCRALSVLGLSGKTTLITSDLFQEMVAYFEKGTIFASIYARPHFQGQVAMRLVADHILAGAKLPDTYYLPPQIVMRSTVRLFRETRAPTRGVEVGQALAGAGL